jgi:hypothetical protein
MKSARCLHRATITLAWPRAARKAQARKHHERTALAASAAPFGVGR